MTRKPERESTRFAAAAAKFTIGSLDDPKLTVSAQYNPAEVQISQAVAWSPHKKRAVKSDQALHVEFGAQAPRKYTVELVFDGVETLGNVGSKTAAVTIEDQIARLQRLVDVLPAKDGSDMRPHFCVAVWGKHGIPAMSCVIENLDTKYQTFSSTGRVLRATVKIAISEAYRVDLDDKAPLVQAEAYRTARSIVESGATPAAATAAYETWRADEKRAAEDRARMLDTLE